jgi:hypothetical protein
MWNTPSSITHRLEVCSTNQTNLRSKDSRKKPSTFQIIHAPAPSRTGTLRARPCPCPGPCTADAPQAQPGLTYCTPYVHIDTGFSFLTLISRSSPPVSGFSSNPVVKPDLLGRSEGSNLSRKNSCPYSYCPASSRTGSLCLSLDLQP